MKPWGVSFFVITQSSSLTCMIHSPTLTFELLLFGSWCWGKRQVERLSPCPQGLVLSLPTPEGGQEPSLPGRSGSSVTPLSLLATSLLTLWWRNWADYKFGGRMRLESTNMQCFSKSFDCNSQ